MAFFRRTTVDAAVPDAETRAEAAPTPAAAEPAAPYLGRARTLMAALLCVVNAAISGLLLLQHHGVHQAVAAVNEVCGQPGASAPSGCDVVNRSRFAAVRGAPLAAVGIIFYGSLGALLLLGGLAGPETRAAGGLVALGGLAGALAVDVVLLGVQMVAIRAFCRVCLITYAVGALAFALLLPARRLAGALRRGWRGDGRLVLAGWLVATLVLSAGVYAAEKGLDWRERLAAGPILGSPVPPLSAPSAPPGSLAADAQRFREEARAATEQARRLQEILDHPQRLERYFADKAEREYEKGPVYSLKLGGIPFKGPERAPIKVVEYSDFLCPFCRNIAGAFASFLPQSADRVAVYFKNYPLDAECNPHVRPTIHSGACALALGAVCAIEQDKFWAFHDHVFASSPSAPKTDDVVRLGGDAGLDTAALQACMTSGKAKDRLAAEIEEAHAAGVNATPTLFINGKRLPRVNDFLATVDKESARLGLPPLPKQ